MFKTYLRRTIRIGFATSCLVTGTYLILVGLMEVTKR